MRFPSTRTSTRRLRGLAVWAMLPLAALNGRPTVGCVCADGQYKTDCPAMTQAADLPSSEPSSDNSCGGAGCCSERPATVSSGSCCDRPGSRDSANDATREAPTAGIRDGNGCCQVVVESPQPPPLVSAVQFDDDHRLSAASGLVMESIVLFDAFPFDGRVDDDMGQPPQDLVITLRRLII